jgi:hypothetical protein
LPEFVENQITFAFISIEQYNAARHVHENTRAKFDLLSSHPERGSGGIGSQGKLLLKNPTR